MENDVFELTVAFAPVVEVFSNTTQDTVAANTADDVFTLPDDPQPVMNQEIDGSHAYAVVNGDLIVNGEHLNAVGDYDATLALYGGIVDGGVDGYANLLHAVESMNAGHGFG